jgi:hypothetical protein
MPTPKKALRLHEYKSSAVPNIFEALQEHYTNLATHYRIQGMFDEADTFNHFAESFRSLCDNLARNLPSVTPSRETKIRGESLFETTRNQ